MKLEIYGKDRELKTEPTRLDIVYGTDGGVFLVVVNKEGHTLANGNILSISPSGIIYRTTSVSSTFGFKLDDKRRVLVSS